MPILISAIICTFNRASYLRRAIQSLAEQTLDNPLYEILVIDNCSTDNTKQIVTEEFSHLPNLYYIYESIQGLSQARNTGWQNARGEYVAYLDDDAIACPQWLEKILEVFETIKPQPGCVGGKVEPIWEAPRPVWLADVMLNALAILDLADSPITLKDSQWLVGANIAFPKKLLKEVDGFSVSLGRTEKNLLSNEENLLWEQLKKQGFHRIYHPEITVKHHIQASRLNKNWFIRRYYWQGISDSVVYLTQSHPSKSERLRRGTHLIKELLQSPKQIFNLLIPTNDPVFFSNKRYLIIKIGYIVGLLSAES